MIENILYTLMIAVAGWLLYQAGYKDGYDRGYDDCFWRDPVEPEIYMEHTHGGDPDDPA